jgi:hypothetical protein
VPTSAKGIYWDALLHELVIMYPGAYLMQCHRNLFRYLVAWFFVVLPTFFADDRSSELSLTDVEFLFGKECWVFCTKTLVGNKHSYLKFWDKNVNFFDKIKNWRFLNLHNTFTYIFFNIQTIYIQYGEPLWLSGKWLKWENKLNREDPGSLPTPGNLFKNVHTIYNSIAAYYTEGHS